MRQSPNCHQKTWFVVIPALGHGKRLTTSLQVFRIYRDVRFSSDPTPYKARPSPCLLCRLWLSLLTSFLAASLFSRVVSLSSSRILCHFEPSVLTHVPRSRTGRKGPYACYYVQIQPGGKSLVGRLRTPFRSTLFADGWFMEVLDYGCPRHNIWPACEAISTGDLSKFDQS